MVEFRTRWNNAKTRAIFKNSVRQTWWIVAIMSLIFVVFGIIGIVFREDMSDLEAGIMFIVVGVFFTPIVYIISFLALKFSIGRGMSYISDKSNDIYTFDDDHMTVTQVKEGMFTATINANYAYISKAIEDDEYFYLYLSKNQCYVIDKSSVTQGSPDEVTALLKIKLRDKYKSRVKQK